MTFSFYLWLKAGGNLSDAITTSTNYPLYKTLYNALYKTIYMSIKSQSIIQKSTILEQIQIMQLSGHLIDLHQKSIYGVTLQIEFGRITAIIPGQVATDAPYFMPGFIDAHVHIESSMLVPSEFARLAVRHGTVATVSDPHEIANVLGEAGVQYMLENAATVPFKFFFGAPSCVPATNFETAGAILDAEAVNRLLQRPDIWYLSELMNYPGVIFDDAEVMAKIKYAQIARKPVDGHAPGLRGQDLIKYHSAGISTDHECFTLEEAREKAALGMKILIREGSAAKNFEALHPLFLEFPALLMFCSDDKHPDDLLEGHINLLVKRALALGYNFYDVLRAACLHPIQHYNLPVGQLRVGDAADFISIDHPDTLNVLSTYIAGEKVADLGKTLFSTTPATKPNHFTAYDLKPESLRVAAANSKIRVIEAYEGQLITGEIEVEAKIVDGVVVADPQQDILKIVVVNRYQQKPPSVAFIKGFGLKSGAFASTVAHDSHNIVAVGTDDSTLLRSIHLLMETKGGICCVSAKDEFSLPLEVAGLMSTASGENVAAAYQLIDAQVKKQGSTLKAPFMTLSFMALLVIPQLKLSDLGLFDGQTFTFTKLFKDA